MPATAAATAAAVLLLDVDAAAACRYILLSPPLPQGPNALSWDSDILEELGRLQKEDFADKEVRGCWGLHA